MSECPFCHARLSSTDIASGTCPVCRGVLADYDEPVEAILVDGDSVTPAGDITSSDNDNSTDAGASSGDDINATIVDRAGAQTIDLYTQPPRSPEPLNGTDSDGTETSDREIDHTLVSGDGSVAGRSLVGKTTVPDLASGQTIDIAQFPLGAGSDADKLPETVGETLDSVDAEPKKPPGTGTVDMRAGAQTIDSGGVQIDAPEGRPRTVAERPIQATIDSADLSPEVEHRINNTWNKTAKQDGATINTSLKADAPDSDISQTTLVIQSRTFREGHVPGRGTADYDLINLLGEGGMGMVYAARQASIDRTVAIKMLKPKTAKEKKQRHKFLSEAAVTGELEHPNIVPIYDLGRNLEGALFYAMKRVQGTPWDEAIDEKSLNENIEILMKVCDAMAFAHSRGVVHRDLKPENVMLGGFGEVLVMDWGLAVPTDNRTIGGIKPQLSMGGTPAYMAPEMAAGPFDRIGPRSDVYLVGAILYEIVTGSPPHTGRDVMKCLFAAARNQIQPTEKTGELVEIALKAMQTKPEDRYESVQEFQNAIRQYQSHSESIALAARAREDLAQANQTKNYDDFARSMFGFQQAFDLWNGNEKAKEGLSQSQLAYAQSAHAKGDFDLGLSLLNVNFPQHSALHRRIISAKRERDARQQRLKTYKQIGIGLVATVLLVVAGAAVFIEGARRVAVAAQKKAVTARDAAIEAEKAEAKQRQIAVQALKDVETQRDRAVAAEGVAKQERDNAVTAKKKAEVAQTKAEVAQMKAEVAQMKAEEEERKAKLAAEEERKAKDAAKTAQMKAEEEERKARLAAIAEKEAKEKAEEEERKARLAADAEKKAKEAEAYKAYVARIGAAAAKIDENAYDAARAILKECIPHAGGKDYRNWEWGRLWYLCHRSNKTVELPERAECVAYDHTSGRFAIGVDGGNVLVSNAEGESLLKIETGCECVFAVDYSADGKFIAAGGGNSEGGLLKIFSAETGELEKHLRGNQTQGHRKAVLSVEFSADGQRLLTSSEDKTAKIWNLATADVTCTLQGHRGWVWDASFATRFDRNDKPLPEQRIVTVSQDNMAIVWHDETGKWSDERNIKRTPRFRGHRGPVYAAAFAPGGEIVATAGHDKRVLLWRTADLKEFDFRAQNDAFVDALDEGRVLTSSTVSKPVFRKLAGHKAAIRTIQFSKNGKLLISGGHDNTVIVWNVESEMASEGSDEQIEPKMLRGHGEWVRACDISAEGNQVVSVSYDKTARIWNTDGYQEERVLKGRVLEGHDDSVLAAEFSHDNSQIVTASQDRTIKTWDFEQGRERKSFKEGHSFLASRAEFLLDGKRLVTSAVDNTSRLWDVATGTQQAIMEGTGRNAALAVSGDGQWIVTGGLQIDDEYVSHLWDSDGKHVRHFSPHRRPVAVVAISPDSRCVYTGDAAGTGRLWETATGKFITKLDWHGARIVGAVFIDNNRLITAADETNVATWKIDWTKGTATVDQSRLFRPSTEVVSIARRPNHNHLLIGCKNGDVLHWDFESGETLKTLKNYNRTVNHIAISPNGGLALTLTSNLREVRLWSLESGDEHQYPFKNGASGPFLRLSPQSPLWSANFAPDGQHVITVGGDRARLWEYNERVEQSRRRRMSFSPHGVVASAQFSHDATRVISASWDGSTRIWNTSTGEAIIKLEGPHTRVNCATFSPNDAMALTAGGDGAVILWDIDWDERSARVKRKFAGHEGAVMWATFSRDGTQILTASRDKTARLWSIDGELRYVFRGHDASVVRAAFSADGKWIVTGSEDNSARIWNVDDVADENDEKTLKIGEKVYELVGHTAAVTSVSFSPDGQRVMTGSEDYTAKVWDAVTGQELLTLKGHEQEITSVAFSSELSGGRYALTGSHDGKAIIWLASPWDAADLAVRNE